MKSNNNRPEKAGADASGTAVAIITGAASGIGLALARSCMERGMHLVMLDNAEAALMEQADKLKQEAKADILPLCVDVRQASSLSNAAETTFERFNRVDWLFNNAGICGHLAPIWDLSPAEVREVMDINLFGIIHGIQAFLPYMFAQSHRSHIINMSSLYGLCSGSQMAAYSMSKHAVLALSESLHFDLQRLNKPVDVSVACPSFVSTQLLASPKEGTQGKFREVLNQWIERSRPAEDISEYIIQAVLKKTFYILPDKEVKAYCEQRTQAIVEEQAPHKYSIEKIIASLSERASKSH